MITLIYDDDDDNNNIYLQHIGTYLINTKKYNFTSDEAWIHTNKSVWNEDEKI